MRWWISSYDITKHNDQLTTVLVENQPPQIEIWGGNIFAVLKNNLILLDLRRAQGIVHQHGNRHRTDTAGNRGDESGHFLGFVEIHIAHQAVAALLGGIRFGVDAHIDHRRAGFDPVAAHHFGLADGSDQDVRLADDTGQILGARVADRHRGVLADQQQRRRHADDVRAPQHHGVRAFDLDAGLLEQVDAAVRCARDEQRLAALLGQAANVDGRETVHILFDADELQNALLVQVRRQGQLHQNAVDLFTPIQLLDQFFKFFLGNVLRQVVADGTHPQFLASLAFRAHVGR